jgi:hypothetical protein
LAKAVRSAGIACVSIDGDFAEPGLPTRNAHADVMDWELLTGVPAERLVAVLIAALRLRRYGFVRRQSPIGILTHHLAHDEAAWSITCEVLTRLQSNPAVSFLRISEVFA